MPKFVLLAIFLVTIISWLYHPIKIDPNDPLIDKGRPSLNISPQDSIVPVKTNYAYQASTLQSQKAVFAIRK